ncbi:MAG TPA: SIR2 family protein [Pyrinomonadaceae bacterium]
MFGETSLSSRMGVISTCEDLTEALGEGFILFVGSAVSGVAPPRLAMVQTVIDEVLRGLVIKLPTDYLGKLYVKYAESLTEPDRPYRNVGLADNTKFEEFLWLVGRTSSRTDLDDLLEGLYNCSGGEFGPNHLAIAALLKSGRCQACFTTNFDNAIENALQFLGIDYELYSTPGHYPLVLPSTGGKPVLIKLHGDALIGNCVSESSVMLDATSKEIHGPLTRLLAGRNIFVAGYSGLGDIDISPHLGEAAAFFFWCNHYFPPKDQIPNWANVLVLTDLGYPTKGGANLLCELAGVPLNEMFPLKRDAKDVIKEWGNEVKLNAKDLIKLMYEWRQVDPILHLLYEELFAAQTILNLRKYAWGCIQRGLYLSALQIFLVASRKENLTIEDSLNIQLGQAFAFWRVGRPRKSQRLLLKLIMQVETERLKFRQFYDSNLIPDIYRVYLEVSRDRLQFAPLKKRQALAQSWQIDSIRKINRTIPKSSPQNEILAVIVDRHIALILKEDVSKEEIQDLCDRCLNSNYIPASWATITVLLQMSLPDGLAAYRRCEMKMQKLGITHYLRKGQESILVARLQKRLPFGHQLLNFFLGQLRLWVTLFQEARFVFRRKAWDRWRANALLTGTIQVVSGKY